MNLRQTAGTLLLLGSLRPLEAGGTTIVSLLLGDNMSELDFAASSLVFLILVISLSLIGFAVISAIVGFNLTRDHARSSSAGWVVAILGLCLVTLAMADMDAPDLGTFAWIAYGVSLVAAMVVLLLSRFGGRARTG